MQQVVQSLSSGKLKVARVPDPVARPGRVVVANLRSLISAGTEKMAMELAKKSIVGKARERPDAVRRVIEKLKNEGLFSTIDQVLEKLDEPMTMGYSSAGIVIACGDGVQEFKPGDRVATNGPHAGVVSTPKHLCATVPKNVGFDQACFTVLGAIALQGIRLSGLAIGETAFVIGLGLVGQITTAILKAAGVRVIGTDLENDKCELAMKMGAETAGPNLDAGRVAELTGGLGADVVIITASTPSDGPVELAGEAVRQKGKVVAVGAVGMNLPRRPYYFKEAELVVSCSYGPGRYDYNYEDAGHDYPPAYVRWTEQRNMAAVLGMMADGKLDLTPLISHRFPIEDAKKAYELIESGAEPFLGVILEYPDYDAGKPEKTVKLKARPSKGKVGVGCIGAGGFARMTLLPAIASNKAFRLRAISSAGGLSAKYAGAKLGFELAAAGESEVIEDPEVSVVFIITRHNQHAGQVLAALAAKKHVFVEKPLALTIDEIDAIEAALCEAGDDAPLLMVGFNRRFSPSARLVGEFLADVKAPLTVSIRMNAGHVPADHWVQDGEVGGGRIIGEACHAIDLATFLAGAPPTRVFAESIGGPDAPKITDDQSTISRTSPSAREER